MVSVVASLAASFRPLLMEICGNGGSFTCRKNFLFKAGGLVTSFLLVDEGDAERERRTFPRACPALSFWGRRAAGDVPLLIFLSCLAQKLLLNLMPVSRGTGFSERAKAELMRMAGGFIMVIDWLKGSTCFH